MPAEFPESSAQIGREPLDVPRWIRHFRAIRTAAVLLAECLLLEGFGRPC
jgi:hypothetical protein